MPKNKNPGRSAERRGAGRDGNDESRNVSHPDAEVNPRANNDRKFEALRALFKTAKATFEIAVIKQTDVPAIVCAAARGHDGARRLVRAMRGLLRKADLCVNPGCDTEFGGEELPALIAVARPYAAESDLVVSMCVCRACASRCAGDEEISDL